MLPQIPFAQPTPDEGVDPVVQGVQSAVSDPMGAVNTALELVQAWALPVLGAIVILLIGWIVAGWVNRLVVRWTEKSSIDTALGRFLGQIARYGILLMTFIACLSTVGIQTTSFVAVLASVGFAIGLAMQGTLGHFASGVLILFFRPFTIGDFVEVAGRTGTVADIGLFATTITGLSNIKVIISNSAVTSNTIVNYTANGTRRADVAVGVAYGEDLKKVEEVCRRAAASVEEVLEDPEIGFAFTEMAASSLNFSLMCWCKAEDYLTVLHKVRSAVYDALNAEGIDIPFNQIVVHQADADSSADQAS